jgi:hypothetical protein
MFSMTRASEAFSERLTQCGDVQHRLRQQLLQLAVLVLELFSRRASDTSIQP